MEQLIRFANENIITLNKLLVQSIFVLIKSQENTMPIRNTIILDFINKNEPDDEIISILQKNYTINLKTVETLFEMTLSSDEREKNGIVFTPDYIADYIIENTFNEIKNNEEFLSIKVIDPASGSGAFLIRMIYYVFNRFKDINKTVLFIENNLFAIDIKEYNVYYSKLLVNLFVYINGLDLEILNTNIELNDSILINWMELFKLETAFDFVIGNPPYVKVQSMSSEYIEVLSKRYKTMEKGSFNLFYGFVEKSMMELKDKGKLGFIIPNNFLKIKSGENLRKFLKENGYLTRIIDFTHNKIFQNIMTYNSIIFLSKNYSQEFEFATIPEEKNIKNIIQNIYFEKMKVKQLHDSQWILSNVDNVKKYEKYPIKLGKYIKTGIATLKDKLYIANKSANGKITINNVFGNFEIEDGITRKYFKVSLIKSEDDLIPKEQYILFPYKFDKEQNKNIPLNIDEIKSNFPKAYYYLNTVKSEFMSRSSSDAGDLQTWMQYGRSQGLNNKGEKLMYPQFLDKPRFILNKDEESLFSNGFAIYENEEIDLRLVKRILESPIFEEYIKNVSYSISGGFYCYQKKYLSQFSIPSLTKEEQAKLLNLSEESFNMFLNKTYID